MAVDGDGPIQARSPAPDSDRPTKAREAAGLKASGDSASGHSADALTMASVVWQMEGPGAREAGVRLNDLAEEEPLPELKMGAEKYEVIGELGEGGMGKVYLAYDHDLKRRVALKVVKKTGGEFARRFLEEAQVMAQLQHPNIVPVHEVGLTANGRPYYTMDVVRGQSLSDVLKELVEAERHMRPLGWPLARRMQVFVQMGQAVAYAHAKGVVHRDLKPLNVMLGGHGEVQVMDWGLSKVFRKGEVETELEKSLTKPGYLVGTPSYMAPEQARGKEVDQRADIYALGVMLYELLTLRRPFEGEPMEVVAAHIKEEPTPPRQRVPERQVPLELEAACLKALRKRPEDRQQGAEALVAEVQTWLEAEADRERRRELANAKAEEGRAQLEEGRRLRPRRGSRAGSRLRRKGSSSRPRTEPEKRRASWSEARAAWSRRWRRRLVSMTRTQVPESFSRTTTTTGSRRPSREATPWE